MRIRKYVGNTSKEAIAQMRRELGDDVNIISSRTIPKPNGSGEHVVEITVSVDEPAPEGNSGELFAAPASAIGATPSAMPERIAQPEPEPEFFPLKPTSMKQKILTTTQPVLPQQHTTQTDPLQQAVVLRDLREEINALKSLLYSVATDVKRNGGTDEHPLYREVYNHLLASEIREPLAVEAAIAAIEAKPTATAEELITESIRFLLAPIKLEHPLQQQSKARIIAFVGATGVGKTTTLSKLATIAHIVNRSDVVIISADTYRVGGAEQLQTIAAIANIPFRVVYSSQEMRQVIVKESHRDYIFIDTVGRSPNNATHIREIKSFLHAASPDVCFLVQPATSSESSLLEGYRRFAPLSPTHVVITKLDEATHIGNVVGALRKAPLPLAYYGVGQAIPDDIEAASRTSLATMLAQSQLISA